MPEMPGSCQPQGPPLRSRCALILAGVLSLTGCKYEEQEVEIGYLGEAKRNPFLAAERLCQEYGLSAETRLSISDLPPHDTTMILSSEAVRSGGSARLLGDWVIEGGSIIYLLDGGSMFEAELEGAFVIGGETNDDREADFLLEYLEVTTTTLAESGSSIRYLEEEFEVDIPGDTNFVAGWADLDAGFTEPPGKIFEFSYGLGDVCLVANAHPFRNRQIGEKDHAALFWAMVESAGDNAIIFVVGGRISFWGLLWSRGWMVIIPVLLAIVIWLWKSFPRHGPPIPDEEISKRDFSRHVDALGQFLWRQRAAKELLAPARRRIEVQLRTLGDDTHGKADGRHWQSLAERSGLDPSRVQQALLADPGKDPAQFVQISRDLQTIENSQ